MRLFDESAPARPRSAAHSARTRLALAASPTVLAAMLALQPQVVRAQAFRGTADVVLGSVDRSSGTNSDLFIVNSSQNTINWTPDDNAIGGGAIDFLPQNNSATFVGGSGINGSSYTVLNRIIATDPARAIRFAGQVSSDNFGNIWFYAPSGLLISGTAQFNVGSLLLTTNDPVGAAGGNSYLQNDTQFRLQGAPGSTAAITIENNAVINAANRNNSYVIAVAPRINMAGAIEVNGSAALVMAEDVNFTLNGGLFDITANVGSSAGGTNTINGSITGPAGNSGAGDYHRVYMMAVPKNDAITLLLTGSQQIGFQIGSAADVDGNAIIISGGHDITGSAQGEGLASFGDQASAGAGTGPVTISVDAATLSSNLTIRSRNVGEAVARTGTLDAARNIEIYADGQALIGAQASQLLEVSGSLLADASTRGNADNGANRTAGTATISALDGGSVAVLGSVTARANGFGDTAGATGQAGGTGTGGTAQVLIGAASGLQTTSITAEAQGFAGDSILGRTGNAVGGSALFQFDLGAVAFVDGDLILSAGANGILASDGQLTGNATGGLARARLFDTVSLSGNVLINSDAVAGGERDTPLQLGGAVVQAGTALLDVRDGASITAFGLEISARAFGDRGGGGIAYRGGLAQITANSSAMGGSVSVSNTARITATAVAADGEAGGAVAGGSAVGGQALILGFGSASVLFNTSLELDASATGGNGALGGTGGSALGGSSRVVFANAGGLAVNGPFDMRANARGGSGAIGGAASTSGSISGQQPAIQLSYGGQGGPNDLGLTILGQATLTARAEGGSGDDSVGGAATGGAVRIDLQSREHQATGLAIDASVVGGRGFSEGGSAAGADVTMAVVEAGLTVLAPLVITATAQGGEAGNVTTPGSGTGGNATFGRVGINVRGNPTGPGARLLAPQLTINANVTGGLGGFSFDGVGGTGGSANALGAGTGVGLLGSAGRVTLNFGSTTINNQALGGEGGGTGFATLGNGGSAIGGVINIGLSSGPFAPAVNPAVANFGAVAISMRAVGGNAGSFDGGIEGGSGGNATGGRVVVLGRGGAVRMTNPIIDASAQGGFADGETFSGPGGNATGGTITVLATPHFVSGTPTDVEITGLFQASVNAAGGGSRNTPGNGIAGTVDITLAQHEGGPAVTTVGTLSIGALAVDASGFGGGSSADRTSGGNGTGGNIRVLVNQGAFSVDTPVSLAANGVGNGASQGQGSSGDGRGGQVEIAVNGGSATIPGGTLSANGLSGNATGGTVRAEVRSLGGVLDFTGTSLALLAEGLSGDNFGHPGFGSATGGLVELANAGGTLTLNGGLSFSANGTIGSNGPNRSAAAGGTIRITNAGNSSFNNTDGELALIVDARAGNGLSQSEGGNATGGRVEIINTAGALTLQGVGGNLIGTNALAGDSLAVAGDAIGGSVVITATGAGDINFAGPTVVSHLVRGGANPDGTPGNSSGASIAISYGGNALLGFQGNLDLLHSGSGHIVAIGTTSITGTGGEMAVVGNLRFLSDVFVASDLDGAQALGGDVSITTATDTSLFVSGFVDMSLSANLAVINSMSQGTGAGRLARGGSLVWQSAGSTQIGDPISVTTSAGTIGAANPATAGAASIAVLGGNFDAGGLIITGNASVGAAITGDGGVATAGSVAISTVANSALTINGGVRLEANAQGGGSNDGSGGAAFGGSISITNPGTMTFDTGSQGLQLRAVATGGFGISQGGTGTGGSITINSSGNLAYTTSLLGDLQLEVGAVGGDASLVGGSAVGGTASFINSGNISLQSGLSILANATTGNGDATGSATGGTITLLANANLFHIVGDVTLNSEALVQNRVVMGNGNGGTITTGAAAGATLDIIGNFDLRAGGTGTLATGGTIDVTATGVIFVRRSLTADVAGFNNSNSTDAVGTGGTIDLAVGTAGVLSVADGVSLFAFAGTPLTNPDLDLLAGRATVLSAGSTSIGGSGLFVDSTARFDETVGRNASGGIAQLLVTGGNFASAGVALLADGSGGIRQGSTSGIGQGGTAQLLTAAGSTVTIAGQAEITAEGRGGAGVDGDAGAGVGGTAAISVEGLLDLQLGAAKFELQAIGAGGNSNTAAGGFGTGGTAAIANPGGLGTITIAAIGTPQFVVSAEARGGSGVTTGGGAIGGNASVNGGASLVLPGSLAVEATAFGGDAPTSGSAQGGSAFFENRGSLILSGDLSINGSAISGSGTTVGNATAGTAGFQNSSGIAIINGRLELFAGALATSGTNAAIAQGGDASFTVVAGAVSVNGAALADVSGSGPIGRGGTLTITADGQIALGNSFSISASGSTGFTGLAADADGGDVTIAIGSAGNLAVAGQLDVQVGARSTVANPGISLNAGQLAFTSLGLVQLGGLNVDASARYLGAGAQGGGAIGGLIDITASSGTFTSLGAILNADALGGNNLSGAAGSGIAGTARLSLDMGSIDGRIEISAQAIGGNGLIGGGAAGGIATFESTGPTSFNLGSNNFTLRASGRGGTSSNGTGGNGVGGAALLLGSQTDSNLNLVFNGTLALDIDATGVGGGGITGGIGRGGSASVTSNGTLNIPGSLSLSASGSGGNGSTTGGSAFGGLAQFSSTGTSTITGPLALRAFAATGGGPAVGNATGGIATMLIGGGTTTVDSTIELSADGNVLPAATAGDGQGGDLLINISGGTLVATSSVTLTTSAGGRAARAGTIGLNVDGEARFAGQLFLQANASSSVNDPASVVQAGDITINVGTGDKLEVGDRLFAQVRAGATVPLLGNTIRSGSFELNSAGTVSFGGLGMSIDGRAVYNTDAGQGGSAVGGALTVNLTGGTLSTSNFNLFASATGGGNTAGTGGNATGGIAQLLVAQAASVTTNGQFTMEAVATAGSGAIGGTAVGGTVQLTSAGSSSISLTNATTSITATASGGAGSAGAGGNGTGGTVILESLGGSGSIVLSSTQSPHTLNLSAVGIGGASSGQGGTGTGGSVHVVNDHVLTLPGSFNLFANGTGGTGATLDNIGSGIGGMATISFTGGQLDVAAGGLRIIADGTNGSARGGTAGIIGTGGQFIVGNTAEVRAEAVGTARGTNIIRGGTAEVLLAGPASFTAGNRLTVDASAVAGSGSGNPGGSTQGGTARVESRGSLSATNEVLLDATAVVNGVGGGAVGGTVALSILGGSFATRDVNLVAPAFGGGSDMAGSSGTGGSLGFTVSGGAQAAVSRALFMQASGVGGTGLVRGAGIGGTSILGVIGANSNLSLDFMSMEADSFGGVSALGGRAEIRLEADAQGNGGSLSLLRDILLLADGVAASGSGGNAQGGSALVLGSAGSLVVGTTVDLRARGSAGSSGTAGGAGIGGTAELLLTAATGQIGTNVSVSALGTGGAGTGAAAGGNGTGGQALVQSGTSLSIGGTLNVIAQGQGGSSSSGRGGSGFGGFARVASNGAFGVAGDASLRVDATAGGGAESGSSTAGTAVFAVAGGTADIGGNLLLNGNGGVTPATTRGNGRGGTLTLDIAAGSLEIAGGLTMTAEGGGTIGRGGDLVLGIDGALLVGGSIALAANVFTEVTVPATVSLAGSINIDVGSTGSLTAIGGLFANVRSLVGQPAFALKAQGGSFLMSSAGVVDIGGTGFGVDGGAQYIGTGEGGEAIGGSLSLTLSGGSFTSSGLAITAGAGGGNRAGGTGGAASGGLASLVVGAGATANINGQFRLEAGAGAGSGGIGGTAQGGTARLSVAGSATINTGGATSRMLANANGGSGSANSGGVGGNATGGSITLETTGPAGNLAIIIPVSSTMRLGADANGGGSVSRAGGSGTGGSISIANSNQLSVTGNLFAAGDGYGGTSGNAALNNRGSGGTVTLINSAGLLNIGGDLSLSSVGFEGAAAGGLARATVTGGTLAIGGTLGINGGTRGLASDTNQIGGGLAELLVADGATAAVGGFLNIDATSVAFEGGNPGGIIAAGTARLQSAGTITAGTVLQINATAQVVGLGGAATGGTAELIQSGGQITTPFVNINADGLGGRGSNQAGSSGTAGSVLVNLSGGSQLMARDFVTLGATATGGFGARRGAATAGTVQLNLAGTGTSLTTGFLSLESGATGGISATAGTTAIGVGAGSTLAVDGDAFVFAGATGEGGSATGGTARIALLGGSMTVGGSLDLFASGTAVNGSNGGNGTGGTIEVLVGTGNLGVTGQLSFDVTGLGAGGLDGVGGNGVAGTARLAINTQGESLPGVVTAGSIAVAAQATGGNASNPNQGAIGAAGGSATGGNVEFRGSATTATLTSGNISINANLLAGDGAGGSSVSGNGGSATGGAIDIGLITAAGSSQGRMTLGNIGISANAVAGSGGSAASNPGAGGVATGSSILLASDGGVLAAADVVINASATGGRGGANSAGLLADGGESLAGNVLVRSRPNDIGGAPAQITLASLIANATGSGGVGGNGGIGTGGSVQLVVQRQQSRTGDADTGRVTILGGVTLDASGNGGGSFGGTQQAGQGIAGTVQLLSESGLLQLGQLTASAQGFGGQGDAGGRGQGGIINVLPSEMGRIQLLGATTLSVSGIGGEANLVGGDGNGGQINLRSAFGGSLEALAGLNLIANGEGQTSNGGDGGRAAGGFIAVVADFDGSSISLGTARLSADAIGGNSQTGVGGNAFAGNLTIRANNSAIISLQQPITLSAVGRAGSGASGGFGQGGQLSLVADSDGEVIGGADLVLASVEGFGGDASDGDGGVGSGGNASIRAENRGTLVLGNIVLSRADGVGGSAIGPGKGGDGQGGSFSLEASASGTLSARSVRGLQANGVGGDAFDAGGGGSGIGGVAQLLAFTGGEISLTATGTGVGIGLDTSGFGGNSAGGVGGSGLGGRSDVFASDDGARIFADGRNATETAIHLQAGGLGGIGATGGNATAGEILVQAEGNARIDLLGMANLAATATAGDGLLNGGGTAMGGDISLVLGGGQGAVLFSQNLSLSVAAQAGAGGNDGGVGGNALGGRVFVTGTGTNGMITAGAISIDGSASGGAGGASSGGGAAAASGGNARTQTVAFSVATPIAGSGPGLVAGSLSVVLAATGGAGGDGDLSGAGGAATVGSLDLRAAGGGIVIGVGQSNALQLDLAAIGGNAGLGVQRGDGGLATGNANGLLISAPANAANAFGSISLGDMRVIGTAQGGAGGTGGDATASGINIRAQFAEINLGNIAGLRLNATGGMGDSLGGNGEGGALLIRAGAAGRINGGSIVDSQANGAGGDADSGAAGAGMGGNLDILADGGRIVMGGISGLTLNGRGGDGGMGSAGGLGVGGNARIAAELAGLVQLTATGGTGGIDVVADGFGGMASRLAAGDGRGGNVVLLSDTGSSLIIDGRAANAMPIRLAARGQGGDGATGGLGLGGLVRVTAGADSELTLLGNAELAASAAGGAGVFGRNSAGGDGLAGAVQVQIVAGTAATTLTTGQLALVATSTGGAGGDGGRGGDGDGLRNANGAGIILGSTSNLGTLVTGDVSVVLDASGGAGGARSSGGSGNGGDGFAGGFRLGTQALDAGDAVGGLIELGRLNVQASGSGGAGAEGSVADGGGGSGGNGVGGTIDVAAIGGTVKIARALIGNPSLVIAASGVGGTGGIGLTEGSGGNGSGGTVMLGSAANALAGGQFGRLETGGQLISADGEGGTGGSGGLGRGGLISLDSRIGSGQINGLTGWSATARGGDGTRGAGGAAQGGLIELLGTVTATGAVALDAGVAGGDGAGGGNAAGGRIALAGPLDLQAGLLASAQSLGGTPVLAGNGGQATGGVISLRSGVSDVLRIAGSTQLLANTIGGAGESGGAVVAASVIVAAETAQSRIDLDRLSITADASGGDGGLYLPAGLASGGTATGNAVQMQASGTIRVRGNLEISAQRRGGDWTQSSVGNGGGVAGGTIRLQADSVSAGAGGELLVEGQTMIVAQVRGGTVTAVGVGTGGTASGSLLELRALGDGRINLAGGASVDLNVIAGAGSNAAGGAAAGGRINGEVDGLISIGGSGLAVQALSRGGNGSMGGAANGARIEFAVAGGSLAVAGNTQIDASVAGGAATSGTGGNAAGADVRFTLTGDAMLALSATGTVALTADSRGGQGGDGPAGGAGGQAIGGSIGITGNGIANVIDLGAITLRATGTGGDGGNGQQAGNGAQGLGGFIDLSVTGTGPNPAASSAALVSANLNATGSGGAAGAGTGGVHGNGSGGGIRVASNGAVANVSGGILASANGNGGGFGNLPGTPASASGGAISIGAAAGPSGATGLLSVAGALVAQTNGFDPNGGQSQPGTTSVFARDGSLLQLGSLNSSATGNFAPATTPRGGLIATTGSRVEIAGNATMVSRDSLGLNDGGDIIVGGTLMVSAAGSVVNGLGSAAGAGGNIAATSLRINGSLIDIASSTIGTGDIEANAGPTGMLRMANISAITSISLSGQTIAFAGLRSGTNSLVSATGNINGGSISTGGRLQVTADGTAILGALDAGIFNSAQGMPTDIYVRANGNLQTGALHSASDIGLVGLGNISATSLTAGRDAVVLATGPVSLGDVVATGSLFIGNASQRSLIDFAGGAPNYAALLAAAAQPFASRLSASSVTAGTANIATGGLFDLSGAFISLGRASISADSAALGIVSSGGELRITTLGALGLASASSADRLSLVAGGAVTGGAITVATTNPMAGARGDAYVSGSNVTLGAVTTAGDIGLVASGSLTSGALSSGRDLVLLAGTAITTGAIATPGTGRTRLADAAQAGLIGVTAGVPNYAAVFAAANTSPVGTITINGSISTGLFDANASGLLRAQQDIAVINGARLSGGALDVVNVGSQGFLELASRSDVTLGTISTLGGFTLSVDGNIGIGALTVGGSLALTSRLGAGLPAGQSGNITLTDVRVADDISLTAAGRINSGRLSAADSIRLSASGAITIGAIDAGTVQPLAGAAGNLAITSPSLVQTGNINVAGSAIVSGTLGVATGTVTAPGGIVLLDTGGVSAGALTTSANGFIYIASHELLPQITFDQAGNPQFAALLASTPTRLIGDINLTGAASTGSFIAAATGSFTGQAITTQNRVTIDVNSAALGAVSAGAELRISTDAALSLASASSADRLSLVAGGAVTSGAITVATTNPMAGARGDAFVSGSNVTLGAVTTAGDIGVVASGNLASGALSSGRDLVLLSGGTITTAAIATPGTGRTRLGDVAQSSLISFAAGVPGYSALFAAPIGTVPGDVIIGGNISTGLFEATTAGLFRARDGIDVVTGARVRGSTVDVVDATSLGFLDIAATSDLVLGDISADGGLTLSTEGDISAGTVNVGGTLNFTARRRAGQPAGVGGNIRLGDVRAEDDIRLTADGLIATGRLSAADSVVLNAAGSITTGGIDAGTVQPLAGAAGVVFIVSPDVVRTGNINVSGSATLSGTLGVTTGNVAAPGGIVLLDTGGVSAGTLSTSASGFIYIASHQMLPQITFDQAGNPQFASLLASAPVRLIGDITLSGAASTGRFIAAATGSFTGQAITAPTSSLISVAGNAVLNGNIASNDVSITSGNIAIGQGVTIGGSNASRVALAADGSATAMVVGGNSVATAGTYSLSGGEFAALRASRISVTMNSGNLTLDTLALPAIAPAATGDGVSFGASGNIRVVGAVTMAQAGASNRLTLIANGRIEVVRGAGSILLGTSADSPAGTLGLGAPRIWVADAATLDGLASGSLAGDARDEALQAVPATPTGSTLAAGTISVQARDQLLIQNGGTDLERAGFTAASLSISRGGDSQNSTGLLDMVIHGRIRLADGTFATNSEAREQLQFAPGLLTAGSSVNFCIIGGICAGVLPEGTEQPVVSIVNNVVALTPAEEEQREEAKEVAEKLPIILLQRLIDFSPLFSAPDSNDPVTSGGNPSLWQEALPTGIRRPGGLK